MKRILIIITLFAMAISTVGCDDLQDGANSVKEALGMSVEKKVKEKKILNESLGDALEAYCENSKWEEGTYRNEYNQSISGVVFTGKCKYDDGLYVKIVFYYEKSDVWISNMIVGDTDLQTLNVSASALSDDDTSNGESITFDERNKILSNVMKNKLVEKGATYDEKNLYNAIDSMTYFTDFERQIGSKKICGIKIKKLLNGISKEGVFTLNGESDVTYKLEASTSDLTKGADKFGLFGSLTDLYGSAGLMPDVGLEIVFTDAKMIDPNSKDFYKITSIIKKGNDEEFYLNQDEAVDTIKGFVVLYCMANDIKVDEDKIQAELAKCISIEGGEAESDTEE